MSGTGKLFKPKYDCQNYCCKGSQITLKTINYVTTKSQTAKQAKEYRCSATHKTNMYSYIR